MSQRVVVKRHLDLGRSPARKRLVQQGAVHDGELGRLPTNSDEKLELCVLQIRLSERGGQYSEGRHIGDSARTAVRCAYRSRDVCSPMRGSSSRSPPQCSGCRYVPDRWWAPVPSVGVQASIMQELFGCHGTGP